MFDEFSIHEMSFDDVERTSQFVRKVFTDFVSQDYSVDGIEEFFKYIEPSKIKKRNMENHFILLALIENSVAGIIEIRDFNHISLLFVDGEYHKRGIARSLLAMAINKIKKQNSELNSVTVNSSPYGVAAYEKMGFQKTNDEQVIKGIRFIPMKKII